MPDVHALDHPGGWKVVPVHYSMDKEKDTEWVAKAKKRADITDWDKEQEIDFGGVSGTPCFESFSLVTHVKPDIEYDPALPLRLSCDFNVDPMAWIVAQIKEDVLYVIDEIWESPGSVIENSQIFLDRYGDHYGHVYLYGDASGNRRSQKDLKPNYDEIKLQVMQAPFAVKPRYPTRNPSNVNHVRSLNRRLKDSWDNPRLFISDKCANLILDMSQVVWAEASKTTIKKSKKKADPYFYRTHASDALMALVYRHWPVRKERTEEEQKKEKGLKARNSGRKKTKRVKRLMGQFPT